MKKLILVLLSTMYLAACDGSFLTTQADREPLPDFGSANIDNTDNTPPVQTNSPNVAENTTGNISVPPSAVGTIDEITGDVILNPTSDITEVEEQFRDLPGFEDDIVVSIEPVNLKSVINGRISLLNDDIPVGDVTVKVRGTDFSAIRDENGEFSIELPVSDVERELVLDVTGDAVVESGISLVIPADEKLVMVDTTIGAREPPITFNLETGGELENTNSPTGTSVSVPANAFQFADGTIATGNAQVSITEIDIDDLDGDSAWAPRLLGLEEGMTEPTVLESFGMADFRFSQDGRELNLRPGAEATIKMNIVSPYFVSDTETPEVVEIVEGDAIPLWHFDTNDLLWKEEGAATVIADAESASGVSWSGQVSHFSSWNADKRTRHRWVTVNVNIVDQNGNSIPGVTAETWTSGGVNMNPGNKKVRVRAFSSVRINAAGDRPVTYYSQNFSVSNVVATRMGAVGPALPATQKVEFSAGNTGNRTITFTVSVDMGPRDINANIILIPVDEEGNTLTNVTIERYRATASIVGTQLRRSVLVRPQASAAMVTIAIPLSETEVRPTPTETQLTLDDAIGTARNGSRILTPASTGLTVQANTKAAVDFGNAVTTRVSVDQIVINGAVPEDIISYPASKTKLFKTYEGDNTLTFKVVIKTKPTPIAAKIKVILVDFMQEELRDAELISYTATSQASGSSVVRNVQNLTPDSDLMTVQGNTQLMVNMGIAAPSVVSLSNIVVKNPYRVFAIPDSQTIVFKTFADNTVTFRVVVIPQ